jgi:CHASE3 domain sensor protein
MEEARGHCHKISNIYDKYLKRPIHDFFDPEKAEKFDSIFRTLDDSDYTMLGTMESVTNWLKQEASQTLELLEDGDLKAANQRIKSARQSAKPEREKLTHAMAHLRRLQAKFIAEAETV